MNNSQIKALLLDLNPDVPDFTVIMSGKVSKKINGLYKPASMEIILHNENFNNDNELIYTAIHEFAHHVQFTDEGNILKKYKRAHSTEFYAIFYDLLEKAEEKNYYQPNFQSNYDLKALTEKILKDFIIPSGDLMKEMGSLLIKAYNLCKKHGLRFDDYLDRILNLPRNTADLMMKASAFELDSGLGYEKMKVAAKITDPIKREAAVKKFMSNTPIEKVKQQMKTQNFDTPIEKLEKEKKRVQSSITKMQEYLIQIDEELSKAKKSAN